jgi:hypothetical protein
LKYRKLIILNYFGKLPVYAQYFFESCKKNTEWSFIVLNNELKSFQDQNISFVWSDLTDFNKRASQRLGININLPKAFKICDLRPAYGVIYEDLISGFDFWGFCDLDIILGQLDDYLPDTFLEHIDVYSSKPMWSSGSFSLYRNSQEVNNLFRFTHDWKIIFTAEKYFGFDECLQRWDGKPIPISERTTELLSIYDLVHANARIRAYFADTVIEWPKDILKMRWESGRWTDLIANKPFLYFHLLLMKNSWRFYQPRLDFSKPIFVSPLGLSEGDHTLFSLHAMLWKAKRFFYCLRGVSRSVVKLGPSRLIQRIITR